MKMNRMSRVLFITFVIWSIVCLKPEVICANDFSKITCVQMEEHMEEQNTNKETGEDSQSLTDNLQNSILEDMDVSEIQSMLDELLGKNRFSFIEAIKKLMTGEEAFSKETVQELLRSLFFSRIGEERETFMRILLLVLLAAVFANFAAVFDDGQIGEISFYVVYLLLFMILADSFSVLSLSLQSSISWMAEFMKGLAPAYFMVMAASGGAATAAAFYEGILLLVWLIQWLLLNLLLPGVNLYILLKLVNHLSREEMLGKMSELLHTIICWGLKSLLGLVAGMQIVRSLVSPVMDSLKRTAIGKTASIIPGIGGAVNTVTELVITSAVLVRNCMGVVILFALVLAGAGPVFHYVILSLSYRFLAALSQPVSDKRIVECLSTMGEGCSLLLRVLFTAEILCMLTVLILIVSFRGGI